METLIARLLELLRAEEGRVPTANADVDLVASIGEAWASFARAAEDRGLVVAFRLPSRLPVATDTVLFRSILHNLLANATQYAPDRAPVAVTAKMDGARVELTVANPAPGLTHEDPPNLFERLWRIDESRSDGGHHGLGLSLSREFARLLGWNLTAGLSDAGELTMTLRGPAQPVKNP